MQGAFATFVSFCPGQTGSIVVKSTYNLFLPVWNTKTQGSTNVFTEGKEVKIQIKGKGDYKEGTYVSHLKNKSVTSAIRAKEYLSHSVNSI